MVRRRKEKIYRRRRPLRILLRVLGVSVVTTLILLVVIFFWFQRYIVHTPDGVRLDVPFLRGILDEIPKEIPEDMPQVQETPAAPAEPARPAHTPMDLPPFRSVLITNQALEEMPDVNLTLEGARADAVLIPVNDETGQLWWESDVEMARRYGLYGTGDVEQILGAIPSEIERSALLLVFRNQLMAHRNPPAALYGTAEWLDPRDADMREYVIDLALELGQQGFDEIVLTEFTFPSEYAEAEDAVIVAFLQDLAAALAAIDVSLSVMTRERDWTASNGEALLWSRLSDSITRFYCILSPETGAESEAYDALLAAVQSVLGYSAYRFVPVGEGSGPEGANWTVQF